MESLLLGLLMLIPSGIQEAVAAPSTDEPLRLMSFNIRYGSAADGMNGWLHRDHLVLETIQRFDPDVLGVQEALAFQVEALHKAFAHYTVIGEGRRGGKEGEYSALFVRKDRFELVQRGQFWLSEDPDQVGSQSWDAALPRICTWAQLRDRRGKERVFTVMNTHFDHRGKTARHRSAELIGARMPPTPMPCVVMGDLNAGESSPPLEALRAAGLVDTYRVLHPERQPSGTFHGFRGGQPGNKIDYVMMRGPWTVEKATIDLHHEKERYPSDHYPVRAVLRWPASRDDGAREESDDGGGRRH